MRAVLHPVVGERNAYSLRFLGTASSRARPQSSRCRDPRRHLPWGLVPFGEASSGDRLRSGLPRHCLPFSGFLTLSTVSSRLGRVVLFHTTSAPRILAFRAFPSQPAVTSFNVRYSRVVDPRVSIAACVVVHAPAPPDRPVSLPRTLHRRCFVSGCGGFARSWVCAPSASFDIIPIRACGKPHERPKEWSQEREVLPTSQLTVQPSPCTASVVGTSHHQGLPAMGYPTSAPRERQGRTPDASSCRVRLCWPSFFYAPSRDQTNLLQASLVANHKCDCRVVDQQPGGVDRSVRLDSSDFFCTTSTGSGPTSSICSRGKPPVRPGERSDTTRGGCTGSELDNNRAHSS